MGLTARRYRSGPTESVISLPPDCRVVFARTSSCSVPRLAPVIRRDRHGRGLRVSGGVSPRSAVGLHRVAPVVEAAAVRLARLTGAGHSDSAIPSFEVIVAPLPTRDQIDATEPSDVAEGALLARHQRTADGVIVITVFARPLLLWTDGTGASLPRLVRQAMAEQLALAVGLDARDLDPEVD